jgi:hypothetical protein
VTTNGPTPLLAISVRLLDVRLNYEPQSFEDFTKAGQSQWRSGPHWSHLWGKLIGLYWSDSGGDSGGHGGQSAGPLARGHRDAGVRGPGQGIPFVLVALLVDHASTFLRRLCRSITFLSYIGSSILIFMGISLLFHLFSAAG